ncbi:hypothetical protein BJ742DRAFT_883843 [Cladochytrium replicatum]|nr:hypothetical protein BJ742DRAFT_883843 [Cladochytrium replicatum]
MEEIQEGEPSSVKIGVRELAEDAKGGTKAVRFPAIPLHFSLLITMVPAIALAIVPTCVILFGTMENSTGALSQVILSDTVARIVADLTTELVAAEHVTTAIASNPALTSLFSGPPPYYGDAGLNLFMYDQLAQTVPLQKSILSLCQKFNQTGTTPPGTSPDVITQVTWLPRDNGLSYCDWTNTTGCYYYPVNPITGVPFSAVVRLPFPGVMDRNRLFPCLVMQSCPAKGIWVIEMFSGSFSLTFGKCARGNQPAFGASVIVDASTITKNLLSTLQPTENSKLFAISFDWKLVVSNNNDMPTFNTTTSDFNPVVKSPDPIIAGLGAVIQAHVNGNISDLKSLTGGIFSTSLSTDASRNWYYMVQTLSLNMTVPLVLVVAIPYADFFDDIRTSQKTSIGLTAAFGCMSFLVVAAVAFGVTMPIRTLTKLMQKVTKFDFSMLEGSGGLSEENVFSEIREMEKTFNIMVKAFAAAIKRNRQMATGTVQTFSKSAAGSHHKSSQ